MIKRVYILAKQTAEFSSIASRVRAMLFLATPHRGADFAQILTKILNISPGPRPFVLDLHRNSLATQSINDEFPHHSKDLKLFSFYETLPTSLLVGKGLVVNKDLATLGYSNERTAYLSADHHGVCKYATKRDPNYLIVRNALASIIDDFRTYATTSKSNIDHEQRRLLDKFLGTSDAAEDDFMSVDSVRIAGSCEWLMRKASYLEWQESANTVFYWISAKPATGKTILSGKVVHHLKSLNKDCSFCFFDHGNKAKSNITSFLLLMARQMALLHTEILRDVLELCRKDDQLKKAEYQTIWRILYVETILKQKLARPQYWVIDALDECQAGVNLVPMLIKVMKALPVRIFLTSRDSIEVHRASIPATIKVVSEEISKNDTQTDIKIYLDQHMDEVSAIDNSDRNAMKQQILLKSDGCFLWVNLVLAELKRVVTLAEIHQVLEEVHSDMDDLYSRILENMSRQQYGKNLAKAILTWTVCAARPLTTAELHSAVQLHIKDTVLSVKKAITSSCGHLLYVDSQSRVHVVHQTVRDYLLRASSTSEFGIVRRLGHKELAMSCLEYLCGPDLAGPTRRKLSAGNMNPNPELSAFASYACNSFFEHLLQVSSTDDDVLEALYKFFNSHNVLSWIEFVTKHSDLKLLIQTGKALKNFLQRRSKHMSPFGKEVALLDSWATDLIQLVTKFGKNLLAKPSSIYRLIPPFCPLESAPRKLFGPTPRDPKWIQLVGLSKTTWGDCLSTIIDPQEQFSGLACSATYFAIGTNSGTIRIFNQITCQEVKMIPNKHITPIRLLRFGIKEGVLVSAGSRVIRVWDTATWTELWAFDIPAVAMSLSLTDDDQTLLVSLKNNLFTTWDLTNRTLKTSYNWTHTLDSQRALSFHRPIAAACNFEERLLAVVYRGQDILLWDFETDCILNNFTKEAGACTGSRRNINGGAISVAFGAGPNVTLLAVIYLDGDLVVFDTNDATVKNITLANAQVLASSPDGRTLATGDSEGQIQVYDFETLKLLYRIRSDDYRIRFLDFSSDSCRILDIRASQCQVWAPVVLVRQDTEEELSDTVSISTAPQEIGMELFEEAVLVTSMVCHKSSDVFFVGKDDGAVYLYETTSGTKIKRLFSHADGVAIVRLYFDEKTNLLSSVDSSGRVVIHKLIRPSGDWGVEEACFDHRAGVTVDQILFTEGYTRTLICSAKADTLWDIDIGAPGGNRIIKTNKWDNRRSYKWITHPENPNQLILISNRIAHIYEWQTLRRLTNDEGISLRAKIGPELVIRSITPCFHSSGIATAFGESSDRHCRSKLLLWNSSDFTPESTSTTVIPSYRHLTDDIDFLIGTEGEKLVFLHSDNWVCSTDPQNPSNVIRHFFLPIDWLTSNIDLMIDMTSGGDILFVRHDEVAVIKNGLRNVELSMNNTNNRRPSPICWRIPSGEAKPVTFQLSPSESKVSDFKNNFEHD